MRFVVLAALAGLTALPGAPAVAEPVADGQMCGLTVTADPSDPEGIAALVDGGPISAADTADPIANPVSITLICTVQTGPDSTHDGTDFSSASATGESVAVLPPTIVDFPGDPDQYVSLCTALTVVDEHGGTHRFYWDDVSGGGENRFSTSSGASCQVPCNLAQPSNCDPPPCDGEIRPHCDPVPDLVDLYDLLFVEIVDPVLCPMFASLAPGVAGILEVRADGDFYVAGEFFWDCPPYETP